VRIPKAERARPREIRVNASGSGSAQVRSGAQSQQGSQSQRVSSGQRGGAGDGSRDRDPEEEGSAAKSRR
ncbi:MAG TPA: hypothetical protein VHH32_07625, partial [Gemmatimonadales bacterium]|nr:hypothetical protein [Gemmatimonadales bacterium]